MIPGMQDTERSLPKINDVSDDFAELRKNAAIYVDKTGFVHKLVSDPNSKIVFVSRPRRFGKSLMISTLKAMFQGLAIMDTDWDWDAERRSVIHLNMGMCAAADYDTFATNLPGDGWHVLSAEWDEDAGTFNLRIDGRLLANGLLATRPRFGLSYLHLQTLAESADFAGTYMRCLKETANRQD